jgi:hypothetical protein
VRDDGVIDGTEFKENFNAGLAIQGDRARVSNVYAHDNGRYGVSRRSHVPIAPIRWESCSRGTRSHSTIRDARSQWRCGRDQVHTDRWHDVRGNHVQDNYGGGLWFDVFRNADVHDNDIQDNLNWGILYEISFGDTKIHDNTLTTALVGLIKFLSILSRESKVRVVDQSRVRVPVVGNDSYSSSSVSIGPGSPRSKFGWS